MQSSCSAAARCKIRDAWYHSDIVLLNRAAVFPRHVNRIGAGDVISQRATIVNNALPLFVGDDELGYRSRSAQELRQKLLILAHVTDFDSKTARKRRKC